MNNCDGCLEKQLQIDHLNQRILNLEQRLAYAKKRDKQGFFGSSTPSSKVPIKENTKIENPEKNGGAKTGHKGYGRAKAEESGADKVEYLFNENEICPDCASALEKKGYQDRTVLDTENVKPKTILFKCEKKWCSKCRKTYTRKPDVFDKGLYGNNLIAQAAVMHYYHGLPIGRIEALFGGKVSGGALFSAFHKVAGILKKSSSSLIDDYRNSLVKHADETGWRTDGNSGYAWIFCSNDTTIFQFENTRSSSVPKKLFGENELGGFLVVDRYAGYNKIKCKIQYCYAHLLRAVQDLGKEFDSEEVLTFVSGMSYYLSQAMQLRKLSVSDDEYFVKAKEIKGEILKMIKSPAENFGIKNIQEIFIESHNRLYHWVEDRNVPPENNKAERELRPTVVARKVSFGSQSKQGADTRSIFMTYLHTASKRIKNIPLEEWFKKVLNTIARNPDANCYELLNQKTDF
jgi:hypothetical protein